MPQSVDARNYELDQRYGTGASSGTYISLHSADPAGVFATASANEMSGAPYARVQLNMAAAAAGSKGLGASAVISVQAGDAFSHYGLWRIAAAGVAADFCGSGALSAAEGAYGSNGTYTVSALTISIT
jgi:hypothetical protein